MQIRNQVIKVGLLLCFLVAVAPGAARGDGAKAGLVEAGEGLIMEAGSGRMWTAAKSKNLKSAEEVEAYLATLNKGPHSDWRLPTKQELLDFITFFDIKKAGDIKLQLEGNYWVMTEKKGATPAAWEIGDQCEPERFYYEKTFGSVRAIRP